MKNYLYLGFLVFMVSCVSKDTKVEKLPVPVIVDTMGIQIEPFYGESEFPTNISTARYQPYYIGRYIDTIFVCDLIGIFPPPPEEGEWVPTCEYAYKSYYKYWESDDFKNYKNFREDTVDLKIYVDTSQKIVDLYPTIVKNVGMDSVDVGNGMSVSLILEALDYEKGWRPIQKDFMYLCGNGVSSLILPPENIIFTLTPRFKGLYRTKLRLKLGNNYSNEFEGSINPHQFISRY